MKNNKKLLNKIYLMFRILSILDNSNMCSFNKLIAIKHLINEQFELHSKLSLRNVCYSETWAECFNGPVLNCELFTPSLSGDEEKGE